MKIRMNDEVLVIAGKDRGKRGRVIHVFKHKKKVVVEGVNVVTRHLRRNPQNPQAGGRVQRPAPIDVSNVMVWSPTDERAVRIRYEGSGRKKGRVSTKTGSTISVATGRAKRKKQESSSEEE